MSQKFFNRKLAEIDLLDQGAIFIRHPPDSSMAMVTIRVAVRRLVMTDNGIVPIHGIEGSVRPHVHINHTKGSLGGKNDFLFGLSRVTSELIDTVVELNAIHIISAPNGFAAMFLREVARIQKTQPGIFSAILKKAAIVG